MAISKSWVVCELTGSWAAALRASFARQLPVQSRPRLSETRTLDGLREQLNDAECQLVLIEFRLDNLSEALQLSARATQRQFRFAALLSAESNHTPADSSSAKPGSSSLANLLWEIGALEVIDSPRQVNRLLPLHSSLLAAASKEAGVAAERPSFADWAWSCIPWQDA